MRMYKGFRIEPFEGVNVGYELPARTSSSVPRTGKGRKVKGFLIHYPDSDGSRFCDTLMEAKDYIDSYMGDTESASE